MSSPVVSVFSPPKFGLVYGSGCADFSRGLKRVSVPWSCSYRKPRDFCELSVVGPLEEQQVLPSPLSSLTNRLSTGLLFFSLTQLSPLPFYSLPPSGVLQNTGKAAVNPDMPVFGSALPVCRCRRPSHHTCSFPATDPAGFLPPPPFRPLFFPSARSEQFSLSHLSDPHLTLETHHPCHLLQETFLVPITSG